jgi:ABC-type nitrate/sulfonate/bicarbonate transport system substrate-binding protein
MYSSALTRRNMIAGGGAGMLAGALGLHTARAETKPVSLQLSWLHSVQFAGSYLALNNGWWADEGLEVRLLQGGPNAPVEPPVVAGNALIGISAADYTAAAVAQGAPFKIIGVAMQKNPFAIASLPANPVSAPRDLEGKRIGMALANRPVLQALCSLNDVSFDAIEIVPTQYSAQPLVAGEVDCLLCWETDLPVAMAIQGIEVQTMLMADHGYALHSQTYITTEESLAKRRAELVALMAGELRGWRAYRADTDAAAELTLRMFPDAGLDLPTQKMQAGRQVPLMFSELTDAQGFGWWSETSVEANIETLALLGRQVRPDLWDRSILEAIHGG